ncbi:MAG TPA: hypothetical protein VLT88_11720, partial [Desulfosarcina sp.]|nr:hypothetical protein [Desulfosarcina sp.]
MNESNNRKWPAAAFFLASGLFFAGCVWYLAAGAMNPQYYWQPAAALAGESAEPQLARHASVLLAKDRGVQVDGARIVYRGSRGGVLHMELYILELDPHYGYPHRIDEGDARSGFRMGEHRFQVLAASDGKVSLK